MQASTRSTWSGSRRRLAVAAAGVLLVLGAPTALVAYAVGSYPFGNSDESYQCRVVQPLPPVGGPWLAEDTQVQYVRTLIPLGIECTLDSLHDAVGPQITHHQSWVATVLWLASSVVAVLALACILAFTALRLPRPRRAAN